MHSVSLRLHQRQFHRAYRSRKPGIQGGVAVVGRYPGVIVASMCHRFCNLAARFRRGSPCCEYLGFWAALFLALYSVTLGLREEEYRILRRIGIDGFALSSFAGPGTVHRPVPADADRCDEKNSPDGLSLFCIALPLLGIAAEVAKWAGVPRHAANNTVAWNAFGRDQCLLCRF